MWSQTLHCLASISPQCYATIIPLNLLLRKICHIGQILRIIRTRWRWCEHFKHWYITCTWYKLYKSVISKCKNCKHNIFSGDQAVTVQEETNTFTLSETHWLSRFSVRASHSEKLQVWTQPGLSLCEGTMLKQYPSNTLHMWARKSLQLRSLCLQLSIIMRP